MLASTARIRLEPRVSIRSWEPLAGLGNGWNYPWSRESLPLASSSPMPRYYEHPSPCKEGPTWLHVAIVEGSQGWSRLGMAETMLDSRVGRWVPTARSGVISRGWSLLGTVETMLDSRVGHRVPTAGSGVGSRGWSQSGTAETMLDLGVGHGRESVVGSLWLGRCWTRESIMAKSHPWPRVRCRESVAGTTLSLSVELGRWGKQYGEGLESAAGSQGNRCRVRRVGIGSREPRESEMAVGSRGSRC